MYSLYTLLYSRYITDGLLCILQLGFCCVYVVFISHNMQIAFGLMDVRVWMFLLMPCLIAMTMLVNIKNLAYCTTAGNVIVLVGLGIIFQYLLVHVKSPFHYPAYDTFVNTAVSSGQIVYAFEGVAVVCTLFSI